MTIAGVVHTIEDVKQYTFSTAPLRPIAEACGIDNPYALAREVGLSYPTARKWFLNEGMGALDATSLRLLADYFQVSPCQLFEIVEQTGNRS